MTTNEKEPSWGRKIWDSRVRGELVLLNGGDLTGLILSLGQSADLGQHQDLQDVGPHVCHLFHLAFQASECFDSCAKQYLSWLWEEFLTACSCFHAQQRILGQEVDSCLDVWLQCRLFPRKRKQTRDTVTVHGKGNPTTADIQIGVGLAPECTKRLRSQLLAVGVYPSQKHNHGIFLQGDCHFA